MISLLSPLKFKNAFALNYFKVNAFWILSKKGKSTKSDAKKDITSASARDRNTNSTHTKHENEKSKLCLSEYDGQEFDRLDDPMDKIKPYDNTETKIYHPELKEQYEKRKDVYHTLDTPYYQKEIKQNSQKEEKSDKEINKV